MSKLNQEQLAEQTAAIAKLQEWLKPGSVVTTILKKVSASGMTRRIRCAIAHDGEVLDITYWVARAVGSSMNDDGIKVTGCGMDMGFHLIYNLSWALFPNGFIPAEAGRHGRNGTPDTERDTDGGYALQQRWL